MSHKDLWIAIMGELATNISRAELITWFRNTAVLSSNDGTLKVGLPLPVFMGWHLDHFSKQTLEAAKKIDPSMERVEYEVDIALAGSDERAVDILKHFPKENEARKLPGKNEQKTRSGIISKRLNARYTLESYIVSPENRLAHAACQNVARYPGGDYNPLFIHGGVGLGKTHLLQGVAAEMIKNNPDAVVIYTTTENLINETIDSMRSGNMDSFRNKYRKVDALIVDDVQFMENKDKSQEEFFHTFNTLYDMGKQIVLSSDRPPHELKLLQERLISRFESGMSVEVKLPDYETRLAILQSKLQSAQVFMNQDAMELMANKVTHSVRALEGAVKRAIAKYEFEHTALTVKTVAELIGDSCRLEEPSLGNRPNRPSLTLPKLIELVTRHYAVTQEDMVGASRAREFALPRQVIMYLANVKLSLPLSAIGRALGNRNHTTVMHAVSKVRGQLGNNRQLLRDINAIALEAGMQ